MARSVPRRILGGLGTEIKARGLRTSFRTGGRATLNRAAQGYA
jgi:hypothetical protein